MAEYKYIVWVGGCDDYYVNYNDAKRDADEWIAKGYDDVIIEEICNAKGQSILELTPKVLEYTRLQEWSSDRP